MKKWIVCAALAALVGVGMAEAQVSGPDAAKAFGSGGAAAFATGAFQLSSVGYVTFGAVYPPALVATLLGAFFVDRANDRAERRAECDALPPFEERTNCRRRHRGVEPGRFQPTGAR